MEMLVGEEGEDEEGGFFYVEEEGWPGEHVMVIYGLSGDGLGIWVVWIWKVNADPLRG